MLRKIIGFLLGSGICVLVLSALFSASHAAPRGAGWGLLVIAAGMAGARVLAGWSAEKGAVRVRGGWFSLAQSTRLVAVASALWVVLSYGLQGSEYEDRNNAAIWVPVAVAWLGLVGFRYLVAPPQIAKPVADVETAEAASQSGSPVIGEAMPEPQEVPSDSASRARALDELVNRMR